MLLIAVLLPVLFALSALAINIAHMESASTEIQIAVDAAARVAGRTYAITGDRAQALAAAREAVARNPVGNFVVPIAATDLQFGNSDRPEESRNYWFVPVNRGGNAVRVTTRSLNSGSSPGIPPLFPFFPNTFTVRPLRTATSTQGVIDVALVVDRSGSMAYGSSEIAQYPPAPASAPPGWDFGDPVPPNARWLDLIAAVRTFTATLDRSPQRELLALSMYNETPSTPQTLTRNYVEVIDRLNEVSVNFTAGGTAIGDGILEGLGAVTDPSLSRSFASKVLIVMSDGVQNEGTSPESAARRAARAGATVFTITFSDEAPQDSMRAVARIGGGAHFHASDASQLNEAFREIASRLPTLITD